MMTAAELQALRESGREHAVIDVRERARAEPGHVAGATIIPRRLLELRLAGLVPARSTPVVMVDGDGAIAELAARTARELGYTDASFLQGGLQTWERSGGAVNRGVNVPGKAFGEHLARDAAVPQVPAATLREWIAQGRNVIVCDSRTPAEYTAACIPGAVSVPSFDLVREAAALLARYETVVVNCAGRTRSIVGTQTLRELGHDRVVALENGTMGWVLAGFELERGATRRLPALSADADAPERARDWARREGIEFATLAEVEAIVANGGTRNEQVLDVRTVGEFEAGHVPGARNVPSGQLVQRADDFIAVRRARVALVDADETRAIAAAVWLKRMDWGRPVVLEGGMAAWNGAKRALERGPRKPVWLGLPQSHARVRMLRLSRRASLDDARVVSVDPASKYRARHVPGAVWIARSVLEIEAPRRLPDRAAPIVLTCADGVQSVYAAEALAGLGYGDVRVLEGGVAAWAALGGPVEQGGDAEDGDIVVPPYARGPEGMRQYLEWEQRL